MSAIARTYAQLAMGVRKLSELGLVGALHFCAASTALAVRADQNRFFVIASHHPFDVVAVERIKVTLNQLFLGRHIVYLLDQLYGASITTLYRMAEPSRKHLK